MRVRLLRTKLHRATVTGAAAHYHGSLTIDLDVMDAVGMLPYEAITVSNINNGLRAETYAIPGERGSGAVELNGAMARLGIPGDRIIVMSWAELDPHEVADHRPRVVALDERNRIVERLEYDLLGRAGPVPMSGRP